jgi:hypothetical protein
MPRTIKTQDCRREIRLSNSDDFDLETLARAKECTVSAMLRDMIKKAITDPANVDIIQNRRAIDAATASIHQEIHKQ